MLVDVHENQRGRIHTRSPRSGNRVQGIAPIASGFTDKHYPWGMYASTGQAWTVALLNEEKTRTSRLRCTLILTTNQEPSEEAVRDTRAYAAEHGLEIDIWSVSRLAHFLDTNPSGQWLRQLHLGSEQQQISNELLTKLARDSLTAYRSDAETRAWVSRKLDSAIAEAERREVLFIVAESGLGKSVACYKNLEQHIASGGFGLILPHKIIAESLTPEQAIDTALRQLQPALVQGAGTAALALCSSDRPFLCVVEDINKSGQVQLLAEKLAKWAIHRDGAGASSESSTASGSKRWRLLCPLWPSAIASLHEEARKTVQELALIGNAYEPSEGREAVQRRAQAKVVRLSDLEADAVSNALGHDPLLIALHEPDRLPRPERVIDEFIDGSVARLTRNRGDRTASDYRSALRSLASASLMHKELNPRWQSVSRWLASDGDTLTGIRHLVIFGEVISLSGPPSEEELAFRHDRVRDALLADAIAEMIRTNSLANDLLEEPYFAEIIGAALLRDGIPEAIADRVRIANPLALFHALRLFREPNTAIHNAILTAIDRWLADPETQDLANSHLRFEALAALSETQSSKTISIVRQFRDHTWTKSQALFRNGDLAGGLQLCLAVEPWVGAPWRDRQVEHAKVRFGAGLRRALDQVLRGADIDEGARVGALRLAGHLSDPQLAGAIEASWHLDANKGRHLADYLWAAAQSCGSDPVRFLDPVCDAWAALPGATGDPIAQPARTLVSETVRFAFRDHVPVSAISYFILRAASDDLRWPITYMLHGVDHPDAIEFVVRELAEGDCKLAGTNSFSPFAEAATIDWERNEEDRKRPMSQATRDRLLALWQNTSSTMYVRKRAFGFWATARRTDDLEILRAVEATDDLADSALWQRLRRSDHTALTDFLVKLKGDRRDRWWCLACYIWSKELASALEEELTQRSASDVRSWSVTCKTDYPIYEMIMRLPQLEAETILIRHWDHLRFSPLFVQTALYVATPRLLVLVKQTVEDCPKRGSSRWFRCPHRWWIRA